MQSMSHLFLARCMYVCTLLVLNGSLFRNLTLVSYWPWASQSALQRSLRLVVGRHTQLQ